MGTYRGKPNLKDFAGKAAEGRKRFYASLSEEERARRSRRAVMKRYYKPSDNRGERINTLLSLAYDVLLTALDPDSRDDNRALKAMGMMVQLEKLKLMFEQKGGIPAEIEMSSDRSLVPVEQQVMEMKAMDDETLKALARRTQENGEQS